MFIVESYKTNMIHISYYHLFPPSSHRGWKNKVLRSLSTPLSEISLAKENPFSLKESEKICHAGFDDKCHTVWHQKKSWREPESRITLFSKDIIAILSHNNDPMIIRVQYDDWDIKPVMIDPRSSTYVLFYSAFQKLQLDLKDIWAFQGSLVDLSGE